MLPGNAVLRRERALIEAPLDRDLVGLHADTGLCYGFNETAAAVWLALEEPLTFDALMTRLSGRFEMPGDAPRADVERLVRELADEGLIAVAETH